MNKSKLTTVAPKAFKMLALRIVYCFTFRRVGQFLLDGAQNNTALTLINGDWRCGSLNCQNNMFLSHWRLQNFPA